MSELERRIERAFAAAAEEAGEGTLRGGSRPSAGQAYVSVRRRAERRGLALAAGAAAVVAVVAAATVAAVGATGSGPVSGPMATSGAARTSGTSASDRDGAPPAGRSFAYRLHTHCGIDDARIGRVWFEAVRPIGTRYGSPGPGWGNPYQPGRMRLTSPTRAVFTDARGHRVAFRARVGATGPKRMCD